MATSQKKTRFSKFIEVHVPGQDWGKATRKVLTVNGVRISPGMSFSNALSQVVREEMATGKLARTFKDVDFSSMRMVNVAKHESRHDGFICTNAFTALKQQLIQHKDEFDAIIILFADYIRIGAKREHVITLKKELSEISDNISVLCLKDSGKDLERVGESIEKYLQERSRIGNGLASHVNAASNLPRHPALEELANEIQNKTTEIINKAAASGQLEKVILEAAGRGKHIEKIPHDLERVYRNCVKKVQEDPSDDNVERVAKTWIREVNLYNLHHGGNDSVSCVMYLRTTPTDHQLDEYDEVEGRFFYGDLPRGQASGNLAAMLIIGERRGIDFSAEAPVILNDKRKSRWTITRPNFMKLMVSLCSGSINYLFMETMNRAAGKRAQNLLLMKVCQLVEAEIILRKNIGQARELPGDGSEPSWHVTANDVVDMDVARMEELEKASRICKKEIGAVPVTFSDCEFLFKKLSDQDKEELSNALAEIGARKFKKEKFREIANEIKQLFSNEDEDDIFGESSDEEDDDESSGEEDDYDDVEEDEL